MNYIVTMNIGNASVPEAARASMRAAASRWDADFVEVLRPIGANRHAFFQKLQLHHHLPDGSRILYLDGDVLIRQDCPSLFELVPRGHLGLSRHDHPSNRRMVSQVRGPLADFCETVGVDLDAVDDYAHTGMMVFELPLHRAFFTEMNSIIDRYGFTPFWVISDQAPVSAARKKLSLPTYWLPPMFQMTGEVLWENWTAEMRFPIQHFCGEIDRWQAIPRTSWDMLGPGRKISETDVVRWTSGKP